MAAVGVPPNISFSIQNCNSLNSSTSCEKQTKKISAILGLNTTLIFLSDIRLSNGAKIQDLEKAFACNNTAQYNLFHNSSMNKRGVGILININTMYTILDRYTDPQENILGLKLSLFGYEMWAVAIYGPNNNDNTFFDNLRSLLGRCGDTPVFLGGDWNATISTLNNQENIDIFGMNAPPSNIRSNQIYDICSTFSLTDPFRILHPDKRDFTYIPRTGRLNRSRLDFFLVSDAISNFISECNIAKELNCMLFDHKSVNLCLGKPEPGSNTNIFNSTLNSEMCGSIIQTCVIDTTLNHACPETPNIDRFKNIIGNCLETIRNINDLDLNRRCQEVEQDAGPDPALGIARADLISRLDLLLRALPTNDELSIINLTTTPEIFFEILCMNLRNELLSHQGWLKKLDNVCLNRIRSNLDRLKQDYTGNYLEIFRLEQLASEIVDKKLQSKVSNVKIFENLNSERATPVFLALTKNRSGEKLASIKKPDGSDFTSDLEREEYIVKCFEDLYKPADAGQLPDSVIDDFLGPDIVNSPLVQNSKLSQDEADWLDSPLTLAELDISVKKGKLRSAPGADGFSNRLIQKCWPYLRQPFFKYANFCYDTGILTHNFRSANIRLIPKKGDPQQLSNWRPISLLSNFYKILSRAINNRLSKFINRICSRGQKGYNTHRYAQEVLINVWEQIKYCRENNIKGAVVSIDMAKAFDTLSHQYLTKVYKFFNLGPNIIKWLLLLGNEREACISLDNKKNSRHFRLGRGRPQGDNISPTTFNFAVQILIFKLELDSGIKKIPQMVPLINDFNDNFFVKECNRETCNNESLADDNSTITVLESNSLVTVKNILLDFSNISGLKCNFEKSCVMPTFDLNPEDTEIINEVGFKITNKIKLLGVEIVNTLDNIDDIFISLRDKILNLASFWDRFKLSLAGRITVAKTFLISQLNYIGCFLKPSDDIIGSIQSILNNYVKKNLNISNNRIMTSIEDGGLGIFDLKTFLQAQRCTWIARAYRQPIDNWRFDLKLCAPNNNICLIRPCDIDRDRHPILYTMVCDYKDFYGNFSKVDGNFRNCYIFDNPAILIGPNFTETINQSTIGNYFYRQYSAALRQLRFHECFNDRNFKSMEEFERDGLRFTYAIWMTLRSSLLRARNLLTKPDPVANSRTNNIENFMISKAKGSKRFRIIIEKGTNVRFDIAASGPVLTFCRLVDLPVPVEKILRASLTVWSKTFLGNIQREFLFMLRNNYLRINTRLNAYNNEVNPTCTFCRIRDPDPQHRETFGHLFFDCHTTHSIILRLMADLFPIFDYNVVQLKEFCWFGSAIGHELLQPIFLLFWDCVRFVIYKYKLVRHLPNYNSFKNDLIFNCKTTFYSRLPYKILIDSTPVLASLAQALG
jgi:exonuclease III